jgi:MFS family permease
MIYSLIRFDLTASYFARMLAQSDCTGCYCLCHACWLFVRRIASQLCGRSNRPQENCHPFRYHLGGRVYITVCSRCMHPTFHFPAICSAVAQNRGMLITGRVIAGISVGIASTIIPLYQSEIAAPTIRGRLVSVQQWSITWGILLQYFIQFGCSYIQGVASFRIPWAIQVVPAVVLAVGMLVFPESPRWLIDHHRYFILILGSRCPSNSFPPQRGRSAQSIGRLTRKRKSYGRVGTAGV